MISEITPTQWPEQNRSYLNACLAELKARLRLLLAECAGLPSGGDVVSSALPAASPAAAGNAGSASSATDATITAAAAPLAAIPDTGRAEKELEEAVQERQDVERSLPEASRLQMLCRAFSLSGFECDLLLLCALVELDLSAAALCSHWHGDPRMRNPTFSLAARILPDAYWSALSPDGPLRRWRLIEAAKGDLLVLSSLKIDERVLHHLMGLDYLDERLRGLAEPVHPSGSLPPSHAALAERIEQAWSSEEGPLPLICLSGSRQAGAQAIAAQACAALGIKLYGIAASDIPTSPAEREDLARIWEREALLAGLSLLVRFEDLEEKEGGSPLQAALAPALSFLRRLETVALATSLRPLPLSGSFASFGSFSASCPSGRSVLRLQVEMPGADEQEELWRQALLGGPWELNGELQQATSQFSLAPQQIKDAAAEVLALQESGQKGSDEAGMLRLLRRACKAAARPRLDELAERIPPQADWEDLVLPEAQKQILREIESQVRHSAKVYRKWGFAGKGGRGLGISALFAGESGTGKTMAAEVLAGRLDLDLYRIDLSQVVNKYIGETEKNLHRVFDAAEGGGCILLFDEADALFGKRSEVKDSHDRYSNIEVGYLLQRMEAFRGLAILTTNIRSALDRAFLRRIRFIVQFPFPGEADRREIWRRIFPRETPRNGLDYEKLSRLNVTGGSIRNMALHSAFLAAEEDEAVGMRHLLRAAKVEYGKLERPLSGLEIAGWV